MSSRIGARLQGGVVKVVGSPLFWVVFVAAAMGWPVFRSLRTELPPPLPVLGTFPEFRLPAVPGPEVAGAGLRGRTWVASFFFTRCPGSCADLVSRMAKIQGRAKNLGRAFHLVTFSTDPEYDTRERLARYTATRRVSPRMWTFISGAPPALRSALVAALRTVWPDADEEALWRGDFLALIDPAGRLRGFYDSRTRDGADELLRDAGLVINRGG
jgi:protein SCO1/2